MLGVAWSICSNLPGLAGGDDWTAVRGRWLSGVADHESQKARTKMQDYSSKGKKDSSLNSERRRVLFAF